MLSERPDVGWLEVHSENFFARGGQVLHMLERVRSHYPLSLHGVGLSLGSTDPLSQEHLSRAQGAWSSASSRGWCPITCAGA